MGEVVIRPTSNGLVLSQRKMSLPDSGTFPLLVEKESAKEDLLVNGENQMVGSLWGVCLKTEYGPHTCIHVYKISCFVGHFPEFIAGIAQQQLV